jgi:hypothetical protein
VQQTAPRLFIAFLIVVALAGFIHFTGQLLFSEASSGAYSELRQSIAFSEIVGTSR